MKMSESELAVKCMNVLVNNVGPVDAERFVYIMNRDNFDYTEWQKDLFEGETVDSLYDKVVAYTNKPHRAPAMA